LGGSRLAAFFLVVAVALAGCGAGLFSSAAALPTATIAIDTPKGPARFVVEVAADAASQQQGLMYRKEMAPNAGMIFVLDKARFVSFWMKNTYLSLDLLFVRPDGTISSIEPNAIPLSLESLRSSEPVSAVIELNGGRAHQLGIRPGARVHAAMFGNL
jgi:uncharacterized membrane protein (UPF0127 family)